MPLLFAISLALAGKTTVVKATPATGVTQATVAAATIPVKVASLAFQEVDWIIACKGSGATLSCFVTGGGKTASIVAASGHRLEIALPKVNKHIEVDLDWLSFDGYILSPRDV